ncbi:hypothetical protein QBC36DRAFT_310460 [Triangularia setosa]|uniref:C2H2-type domain-containing protein n=1 Tax=Triangularia setosa TaxID=2587417 RepID=A0AAN6W832_9PEZI|nr:hypothetical protein QBC36DRAFT_310460 [Podospora setosa]
MESTIAAHVSASLNSFQDLLAVVGSLSALQDDSSQEDVGSLSALSRQVIQNELSRFKVWAGNIGAHRSGRASLDYRLRDASNIRSQVVALLQDLIESLNDERIPWDQEPSDSSDDSDGYEDDDEEVITAPTGLTELSQISSDITEIINCLFRLTVTIQNPAPHDRFKQRNWVDTSHFEERDIAHVRDMFPRSALVDRERLGKAISRRRQYFKYRELHHQKMAYGLDGTEDEDDGAQSTVASSIAKHLRDHDGINTQSEKHILDEDNASVSAWTDTTFGSSLIAGDRPRIPPIPKAAADGPFECPFCYMMISALTTRAWTKHVLADLRPYICLSPDCEMSKADFQGRHEWMQHVLSNHWKTWSCVCCGEHFDSAIELRTHLVEQHAETLSQSDMENMVTSSEKPKPLNCHTRCHLCEENLNSAKEHARHLGRHQRDLALFALPRIELSSEPDERDVSQPESYDSSNSEDIEGAYRPARSVDIMTEAVQPGLLTTPRDFPRPEVNDDEIEEEFLKVMQDRGWNNLPASAKQLMLAYPSQKKWTLVKEHRLSRLRTPKEIQKTNQAYQGEDEMDEEISDGDDLPGPFSASQRILDRDKQDRESLSSPLQETQEDRTIQNTGIRQPSSANLFVDDTDAELGFGDAEKETPSPRRARKNKPRDEDGWRICVVSGCDKKHSYAIMNGARLYSRFCIDHRYIDSATDLDSENLNQADAHSPPPNTDDYDSLSQEPLMLPRNFPLPKINDVPLNKSQAKEEEVPKTAEVRPTQEPSLKPGGFHTPVLQGKVEGPGPPKGILKQPRAHFPDEPNPVREGVAPHKDDKSKAHVPAGAKWTKISRKMVNPEALIIGKERFEVKDDFVIVLRVLSKEEIQAYADATSTLRERRRKEYEVEQTRKSEETDSRRHPDLKNDPLPGTARRGSP